MSAFRVSISRRSSLLGPAAPRGAIVLLLWSCRRARAHALGRSGVDGASRVCEAKYAYALYRAFLRTGQQAGMVSGDLFSGVPSFTRIRTFAFGARA